MTTELNYVNLPFQRTTRTLSFFFARPCPGQRFTTHCTQLLMLMDGAINYTCSYLAGNLRIPPCEEAAICCCHGHFRSTAQAQNTSIFTCDFLVAFSVPANPLRQALLTRTIKFVQKSYRYYN